MAFIPIPNAAEVVIYFTVGGQKVALTLGFKRADAVTPTNLGNLATAVDNWRKTSLTPFQANAVTATSLAATDLTSETAPRLEVAPASPQTGPGEGPVVANNVAAVVTFKTPLRGRSYTGRNYVLGLEEVRTDSATTWTTATVTGLLAAYAALPTALSGTGWTHAVLSRQHNGIPRVTGVATEVTTYAADAFIDSQRRRLAGRGR